MKKQTTKECKIAYSNNTLESNAPGVFTARKKNGEIYYRASITFRGKHISLGSFDSAILANKAYEKAGSLLNSTLRIPDYNAKTSIISLEKWIVLINYRDNNVYFHNPIYLKNNYFQYYLSLSVVLTFDIEDLFYYASHKIQQRGNRLFVSDYGMQITLGSRYGIKPYAVAGRDYIFSNEDPHDFRYSNIQILSRFHGVVPVYLKADEKTGRVVSYEARLHVKGNYIIGKYDTETDAAIAYNKAVDIAKNLGINRDYPQNYVEDISAKEYALKYSSINLSNFKDRLARNIIAST